MDPGYSSNLLKPAVWTSVQSKPYSRKTAFKRIPVLRTSSTSICFHTSSSQVRCAMSTYVKCSQPEQGTRHFEWHGHLNAPRATQSPPLSISGAGTVTLHINPKAPKLNAPQSTNFLLSMEKGINSQSSTSDSKPRTWMRPVPH